MKLILVVGKGYHIPHKFGHERAGMHEINLGSGPGYHFPSKLG